MAISPYRFSWDDADDELEQSSEELEEGSGDIGYVQKVKDIASDYLEKTGEEADALMEDNMFWFSLGLGGVLGPAVYASYKAGGATAEYVDEKFGDQGFWSDYDESVDLNSLDYTPEGYEDDSFWSDTLGSAMEILDRPLDQMQDYRESLSDKYSEFKDNTGEYISAALDRFKDNEKYEMEEDELISSDD
mgnify:CR=1 FL=1